MRAVRLVWYRLCWPREVTAEEVTGALRILGSVGGSPVVIEAVASGGRVSHHLAVPLGREGSVVHQLRAAVPGLALHLFDERAELIIRQAVEVRLSSRRRPLRTDDPTSISRALLTALAHVGSGEHLVLQWVLGPRLAPLAVPNRSDGTTQQSWTETLLRALTSTPQPLDPEARGALRAKHAEPGWRVTGRLGVDAVSKTRQRQLIRQLLDALRSAEAPSVRFGARSTNPAVVQRSTVTRRAPLRLNITEVAAVSSWPVGPTSELPISKVGSRLVAPARTIPSHGRVVAESSFPGQTRALSLLPSDALRHLHVLGPTGSGKSTLLLHLIMQDINAGRAVVVIEPKRDLIDGVLKRVPPERVDDVVVISPPEAGASRVVGLNPLLADGRAPELVADQLLGIFHGLFGAGHWGPRTSDILASALLTLARQPNATLVALPLLLSDANFRRRILAKIDDPIGLEPFWAEFDSWSEAQRAENVAPAMRRIRPFLLRPDLRAIIGQARPRFSVRQVFTERKILLVDLSKALLGPETAALLGGLVITQIWQATLARSAIEPSRRHPVFVYADEYQEYLSLPTDLADALAQARGLGVGFVLAHQYMHQLDAAMRSAVLANTQSRVVFRLPHEDARILAAGSALETEDFESLAAYECYVQLVADATIQRWCSARSILPGPEVSDGNRIRAVSRERFGNDRDEIETDIRRLIVRDRTTTADDIGLRRRPTGSKP